MNQKLENTSKACTRSSQGPMVECSARYSSTLAWLSARCGSIAPGIAPSASSTSSASAVPMEVRPRQVLRAYARRRFAIVIRWATSRPKQKNHAPRRRNQPRHRLSAPPRPPTARCRR
ncbi:Uncharacterised protein [Mycobacteroides abscessus subsp. abscessus]|nr:Uncharacterised protein [Mycobacteroides abscessus subsp. abscessus]